MAKRLFVMRAKQGPSPAADYLLLGPITDGMLALWWHEENGPDHFSFVTLEALDSDFELVGQVELQRWAARELLELAEETFEQGIGSAGQAVH